MPEGLNIKKLMIELFKNKKKLLDYPTALQIETTNRCNAHCEFCHHPKMKRPLGDMPQELFAKIIEDAKELNVKQVLPFLHGEMFMDRLIFDRLQYINKHLPNANIDIFTNANMLDSMRLEKLCAIKNIDLVNISLNSYNADDYKKRVGLDFSRTINNIKALIKLNNEKPFVKKIEVASVEIGKEYATNDTYNDRFSEFVKQNFPGIALKIGYKMNYLGQIYSFRKYRNIKCSRLLTLNVLYTGLVSLCCMDMEGEYLLGNANEKSLSDIYNGGMAKEYRSGRKNDHMPCRMCNMI
jgi:pyruvate-formate lyase-activating enzyme